MLTMRENHLKPMILNYEGLHQKWCLILCPVYLLNSYCYGPGTCSAKARRQQSKATMEAAEENDVAAIQKLIQVGDRYN